MNASWHSKAFRIYKMQYFYEKWRVRYIMYVPGQKSQYYVNIRGKCLNMNFQNNLR